MVMDKNLIAANSSPAAVCFLFYVLWWYTYKYEQKERKRGNRSLLPTNTFFLWSILCK